MTRNQPDANSTIGAIFITLGVLLFIATMTAIVVDEVVETDEVAAITVELRQEYGITITEAQASKLESGRETEVVGADGELIRIRVTDHTDIGEHPTFTFINQLEK